MEAEQTVQRAILRKREIEAELRKIETFLELYREFSETPGSDEGSGGIDAAEGRNAASSVPDKPTLPYKYNAQRVPRMSQETFEQLVRGIILKAGKPLVRDDILTRFHEIGRHFGDGDDRELGTLKTKLWRARNTIVPIPGVGYWVADTPCPAFGYLPPSPGDGSNF
jgi:hypothetical protein